MARSSSNRKSASARASSVLPTPVGPGRGTSRSAGGVGQAGAAAPDGVGDGGHGLVLADHPLVQDVFEAQQLVHLALHEPADRHAGPLAHDLGDVLLVDLFLQHLQVDLELGEACRRSRRPLARGSGSRRSGSRRPSRGRPRARPGAAPPRARPSAGGSRRSPPSRTASGRPCRPCAR